MDVRYVKQVLRTLAAGAALLVTTASGAAGVLCPVEPSRPHVSAALAPNWGFHQTCWQRFPPVPPCNSAAGCITNSFGEVGYFDHQGMMQMPQSGLMMPDQPMMSQPVSVLPQSMGSQRYSSGFGTPSPADGSSVLAPQPSLPRLPDGYGVPVQPIPQNPSPVIPSRDVPAPAVQTFEPAPISLPPLPSPQSPGPVVPDQSRLMPNRLIFGAGRRIAATSNSFQPDASRGERRVPGMNTSSASAQGSVIPVRANFQGRTVGSEDSGSRYGATSQSRRAAQPSSPVPPGTILAPLRRTPSIPYQP